MVVSCSDRLEQDIGFAVNLKYNAGIMKKIIDFVKSWGDRLQQALDQGPGWIALTLLIGACPGFSLWWLFHLGELNTQHLNELESSLRYNMLAWIGVFELVTVGAYFWGYQLLRERRRATLAEACRTINRYAVLLLIVPVILFLSAKGVTPKSPFLTLLSCLGIGLIGAIVAYRAAAGGFVIFPPLRHENRILFGCVVVFSLAYGVILSVFQVIHHHNLATGSFDLAIYTNTIWQSLQGNLLDCSLLDSGTHITAHFDPILILLAPIMAIAPRAETIMIFEAIWLGLGAIPLYLIAVHRLNHRWIALIISLVYLLHPCLHGLTMYEFHSLSLCGPLVLWSLYFLESNRFRWFFVTFCFLLTVREDMAILGCLIGIYALRVGKPSQIGVAVISLSIIYFAVVKGWVMSEGTSYSKYTAELEIEGHSQFTSLLLTALTNPMFIVRHALNEEKIVYLLQLTVPLLLLPFFAARMRILFAYGLIFILIASKPAVFSLGFQYAILLLPFMLAALPRAIECIGEGKIVRTFKIRTAPLQAALAVGLLLSAVCVSSQYGVLGPNDSFRAGYRSFRRSPSEMMRERYKTVEKVQTMIPDDAVVLASERLTPHFATRETLWLFRKNRKKYKRAEYVVLLGKDLRKRPMKPEWEERIKTEYELLLDENEVTLYRRR